MSQHANRSNPIQPAYTLAQVQAQSQSQSPAQSQAQSRAYSRAQAQSQAQSQAHTGGPYEATVLRQNSAPAAITNRSAATGVTGQQRRPIPSPLQSFHNHTDRSLPNVKSLTPVSPRGTRFPVTPLEEHQSKVGDNIATTIGRPTGIEHHIADEAFEEIKATAARDAMVEETAKSRLENRKRPFATPIHAPAPATATSEPSPTAFGTMSLPSHIQPRADTNHIGYRTASLDSTSSSLSSSTSQHFKHSRSVPNETSTPQDIATLIQSAGSAEAAIIKLLLEKQSVAAHTDQMWRIMEKQRTMIFGLKSDLERALKDKEKYRKKLKEQLSQSTNAQLSTASVQQKAAAASARADSQSPVVAPTITDLSAIPNTALIGRKGSDATDASELIDMASRSSTPQQAHIYAPYSAGMQDSAFGEKVSPVPSPVEGVPPRLPHAPHSASSLHHVTTPEYRIPTGTPPLTSDLSGPQHSPTTPERRKPSNASLLVNTKVITSPQGFSSPKDRATPASRKPPPAPLNLSPRSSVHPSYSVSQVSESDYDDVPSNDDDVRGRQKTRADDDRQRAAHATRDAGIASKKDKKSRSRGDITPPPMDSARTAEKDIVHQTMEPEELDDQPLYPQAQTMASMVSHLRNTSDNTISPELNHAYDVPSLMSPGLPMSPRPGDRPMNSPMPRPPKQPMTGIPMSPRDGGMPLSPRAPRGPVPLPPQTPLSFAPPSSARSDAYHQLTGAPGTRLAIPGQSSPEAELPSPGLRSPGEVYRGLVSEQYPGFLLPPNALPSIYIKVDSSRLRPSRNSYMAPRQSEENPVFILAIFARSDNSQLWRLEKTLAALSVFDEQIRATSSFRTKLPDRNLFMGHAPARIDARRQALGHYFDSLLNTPMSDQAGTIVCGFLTADAFSNETKGYFSRQQEPNQEIQISVPQGRACKDGYLTKRGKNFGGWKARYFVLNGPHLKYFEAPGGAPLGSIKLSNAQIGKQSSTAQSDEDLDNQYRHAFLILEPKRKDSASLVRHVLCAESDEERDVWVECLLQYVDDESRGNATQMPQTLQTPQTPRDAPLSARSPRTQKSLTELNRPSSSGKSSVTQGSVRAVPYQDTVAAEAPIMGNASLNSNVKGRDTPSPPALSSPLSSEHDDERAGSHPVISGPTNATVIQDAQSWGNKPPAQTPIRDKKRSIFGFGGSYNRGRAGSDTISSQQNERIGFNRPVFGIPLAEVVEYSFVTGVPVHIPAVAYRCIEYLRAKDAVTEEGIFRLSGSNIVIKALRERFNTEGDIDLINDEQHYDIHAVASLLKSYLRELPANILTRELQLDFLRTQEQEPNVKLEMCNVLVNRLPRANRELLEALAAFLREIVDHERLNKMSVRNGKSAPVCTFGGNACF